MNIITMEHKHPATSTINRYEITIPDTVAGGIQTFGQGLLASIQKFADAHANLAAAHKKLANSHERLIEIQSGLASSHADFSTSHARFAKQFAELKDLMVAIAKNRMFI